MVEINLSIMIVFVYSEGEFTVEVVIFNNVSSAVISGQLFVISENCQPPPVKTYGPSKIEVRCAMIS